MIKRCNYSNIIRKKCMVYTVVTGGAGFIGTNLCARLLKSGKNLIIIDDLSSGQEENIRYLEELVSTSGSLTFIKQSIENMSIEDFSDIDIDIIYNLACPASPKFYQSDPIKTIFTSVTGVHKLCLMAFEHDSVLLQASTSEVYGDPEIPVQDEYYLGNVNTYGPRACYDEGKRTAETILYTANQKSPGKFRIVRIFNTYGPFMRTDDGRFISNFIVQSLNSEPHTIYGNGTQTRSICFVDDTVSGLIRAAHTEYDYPINIGNPEEASIREWSERIHQLCGTSGVRFEALPQDDPLQRKPDIRRAQTILDWTPMINWCTGLEKTIQYFRNETNI